jgi:hypothetical protein
MTINADDQLFAWLKTRLDAVGAITAIVGSNNGLNRDDWADSDKTRIPRVEYNPFRFGVSENGDILSGQFGITVVCDRAAGTTFGSGGSRVNEGDIWTLESSVIASLANAVPSLGSDYTASPIQWSARRRPTLTPDEFVGRRLNFGVTLYPGTTAPLSGNDADLPGLASNLAVTGWDISVDTTTNTDFTTAAMTVPDVRTDRPLGIVQIRVRIVGDGATIFPEVGSRQQLTFQVASGQTWTNSVLIRRVQWVPSADQSANPQVAVIVGVIDVGDSTTDNQTTTPFTGEVT